jgi:hypothetical protein
MAQRRPKRDRCAEQAEGEFRLASVTEAGKKADELGSEDERPGRRLGEAKSIQHLAGAQPAISLNGLLRDVTIASFEKNRATSVVT